MLRTLGRRLALLSRCQQQPSPSFAGSLLQCDPILLMEASCSYSTSSTTISPSPDPFQRKLQSKTEEELRRLIEQRLQGPSKQQAAGQQAAAVVEADEEAGDGEVRVG
jgi:hypothetical protein